MANLMTGRIRPGAAVECTDGRLGRVDRLEPDLHQPEYLVVTRGWTNQELRVPLDSVQDVRDDGAVMLTCSKNEVLHPDEASGRPTAAEDARDEYTPDGYTRRQPLGETYPREQGRAGDPLDEDTARLTTAPAEERTLELREEELVAHKELREVGEVHVRTRVEEVPGRLEVEAYREEVEVEHEPVGKVVSERVAPWEEDGVLVVPVYEEQLVVTKRLVLREHLRVRRVGTVETHLFEDTLRRERVVVDDPSQTGLVHERYPDEDDEPLANGRH